MSQEFLNTNKIPTRERCDFQAALMDMMIPIKSTQAELEWCDKYVDTVSELIDDPKNSEIRELIMNNQHAEASVLVRDILENSENKMAA
jgi:hypothetical protein